MKSFYQFYQKMLREAQAAPPGQGQQPPAPAPGQPQPGQPAPSQPAPAQPNAQPQQPQQAAQKPAQGVGTSPPVPQDLATLNQISKLANTVTDPKVKGALMAALGQGQQGQQPQQAKQPAPAQQGQPQQPPAQPQPQPQAGS